MMQKLRRYRWRQIVLVDFAEVEASLPGIDDFSVLMIQFSRQCDLRVRTCRVEQNTAPDLTIFIRNTREEEAVHVQKPQFGYSEH